MAWPFSRRRDPDALTASVSVVPHDANNPLGQNYGMRRQRDRAWQADAWLFYHDLGEIRFAARYIGNSLARVRFYVGKRKQVGDPVVPLGHDATGQEKQYSDLLVRIRPNIGDFSSLVRIYGVQQFVAGESFLVASDGLDGERWEVLSTSELRRIGRNQSQPGAVTIVTDQVPAYARVHPDGTEVAIGPNSMVLRFWNRDPEFRERADSPLRPVLDICEALHTAQAMQTAGDRSRLATAGLLLVPTEADLPKAPFTDSAGGPRQPARLMLLDEMLEAMQTAMTDPGSVVSLVPIIAEVRGDLIKQFTHLTFNREVDQTIVARIDHLIRRLAQGLDIPPEIMLGIGDVSHWTAWAVSEQAVGSHIIPMATNFAEDLTVGYLRPVLAAMGVKDLDSYAVGFDASDLVVSPNQADHAFQLYDRTMLGADHVLRTLGFDPEMKPDLDEIIEQILIARAKNPHNPDPGADIAALLGKAPAPTGTERNVIGLPKQDTPPPPNPQIPEQNPNKPAPKPAPGRSVVPAPAMPVQSDTPENKDARRKGPPKAGPPKALNPTSPTSPEGRAPGKKGQRGIKKTSVINQMVAACQTAVTAITAGDPMPEVLPGLEKRLAALSECAECATKVVQAIQIMLDAERVEDARGAIPILCEAAVFDMEDALEG